MTPDADTLDAYLRSLAEADHDLAALVRRPQAERGAVHTPREIAQQPFLWRRTARQLREHAPALRAFLAPLGLYADDEPADPRPQLVFAGAGSSDYVGRSVADLLRTTLEAPSTNGPTTRLTVAPERLLRPGQETLLVHFSRSGNSPESAATFRWARDHRPETVRQLVVTCNREGTLAQLARESGTPTYLLVLDEATHDEGLAMTSSFTSMVVAGQALAFLDRMDRFGEIIERVSAAAEHILDRYTDALAALAAEPLTRAFYLGNSDLLGAAVESALKLQELTAGEIVAQGEDTMAFRHGPISAVTPETLVGFFFSADPSIRRYERDVLDQFRGAFREMGVHVLTVGPQGHGRDLPDDILTVEHGPKDLPSHFQVGPATLVGQLLGLFAAYERGYNVDTPSEDKALYSRTVQGVTLYED